jgi:hypothetical protein
MCNLVSFNPRLCPESGEGVHNWIFHAACCAVEAGMSNEEAVEQIEQLMTRDPNPASEIEDALCSARGERRPAPRWSPANTCVIAPILAKGISLLELVAESPRPIRFGDESRSEEVIDALFPGDPLLCLGRASNDFYTDHREFWRGRVAERSLIVPSPMSSKTGLTKQGKQSFHCQDNTGPRRFLVIEFDKGTLDQQAALISHLENYAPLAVVAFSGSKSLHSWFYCAGLFEDRIARFFDYACSLGADSKLWNRTQFARVPDGKRSDGKTGEALRTAGVENVPTGRQALLFFHPETQN